jgi:glycosyltransferase involved in cell wall biosynthesis
VFYPESEGVLMNKIVNYFFVAVLLMQQIISFEHKLVVLIPSYNNKQWYQKNLGSVYAQKYDKYRVIYIDDVSADGTGELVAQYVKDNHQENRTMLIKNKVRTTAMENIYKTIHTYCLDDEIIVKLDGDDWFTHDNVLARINKEYADGNVWLTYGSYRDLPDHHAPDYPYCHPIPNDVVRTNRFRVADLVIQGYTPGHPLTFYAWLFKHIRLKDMLYHGRYPLTAYDSSMNFYLFEMAAGHFKLIPETLYVHNCLNTINDCKVDPVAQYVVGESYRFKAPYKTLAEYDTNISTVSVNSIDVVISGIVDVESINKQIKSIANNIDVPCTFYVVSKKVDLLKQFTKKGVSGISQLSRLHKLISESSAAHVLLVTAATEMGNKISIKECAQCLKTSWAKVFYLNYDHDTLKNCQVPLMHFKNNVYAWQFQYGMPLLHKASIALFEKQHCLQKIQEGQCAFSDEILNVVHLESFSQYLLQSVDPEEIGLLFIG